jgi:hypothetical protein
LPFDLGVAELAVEYGVSELAIAQQHVVPAIALADQHITRLFDVPLLLI